MTAAKRALLLCAWLLTAAALVLLGYDLLFILGASCDVNEVAGASDGYIIDWPTGERPPWAMLPAYAYSIILLLLAAGAILLRRRVGIIYSGRVWRGVE